MALLTAAHEILLSFRIHLNVYYNQKTSCSALGWSSCCERRCLVALPQGMASPGPGQGSVGLSQYTMQAVLRGRGAFVGAQAIYLCAASPTDCSVWILQTSNSWKGSVPFPLKINGKNCIDFSAEGLDSEPPRGYLIYSVTSFLMGYSYTMLHTELHMIQLPRAAWTICSPLQRLVHKYNSYALSLVMPQFCQPHHIFLPQAAVCAVNTCLRTQVSERRDSLALLLFSWDFPVFSCHAINSPHSSCSFFFFFLATIPRI